MPTPRPIVIWAEIRGGELILPKGNFVEKVKAYPDGLVSVTVEAPGHKRTSEQNRYWWGVCLERICEHEAKRLGLAKPLPKDPVHYQLLGIFGPTRFTTSLGPVHPTSSQMTTAEFSEWVEKIKAHYAAEEGLHIPEPHEGEA